VTYLFTVPGTARPRTRYDETLSLNGLPLPEEDWQYHVSINHSAMCENTEAIINRRSLGIYYFLEQAARTDVFIFEISQAEAEEVSMSTGKQRSTAKDRVSW
jgi:hypothetical protein